MNKEKALQISLRYLSYRPRSIKEMRTYLEKKEIEPDIISQIIDSLMNEKYLDDEAFAEMFASGRVRNNPKSTFALGYELKKKGISRHIIDNILKNYDDEALALKSVKNKFNIWISLDDKTFRKKVINHLRYRGFSYETCTRVLEHYLEKRARKDQSGLI